MKRIFKRKNFFKYIFFVVGFLTLSIFFGNILKPQIYANIQEEIKIGLTSKYNNISQLILKNNNITLNLNGYSTLLSSNSEIKVDVINKYYYKSNSSYSSYGEAKNASSMLPISDTYIGLSKDGFNIYSNFYSTENEGQNFLSSNFNLYKGSGNIISISGDTQKIIVENISDLRLSDSNNNFIEIGNDSKYRGSLSFISNGSSLTLINILPIEEYLYSVLPSEMPSSWNKEALKAQAVAARTYIKSNPLSHKIFDLCDTTHCQVYSGVKSETPNTTTAVNETKDLIAYYDNKPINAVYFSSSGGITDNSENAWSSSVPYLKSVIEINESNYKEWQRNFSLQELNSLATKSNLQIGQVTNISIEKIENERVSSLKIIGTNGTKVLTGEGIRTFFSSSQNGSLDSRYFRINEKPPTINGSINISSNTNNDSGFVTSNNSLYVLNNETSELVNIEDTYVLDSNSQNKFSGNINIISSEGIFDYSVGSEVQKNNSVMTSNYIPSAISTTSYNGNGDLILHGKGWGHGIGMSQYGAKGMAEAGYNFQDILKYYYTGINIK